MVVMHFSVNQKLGVLFTVEMLLCSGSLGYIANLWVKVKHREVVSHRACRCVVTLSSELSWRRRWWSLVRLFLCSCSYVALQSETCIKHLHKLCFVGDTVGQTLVCSDKSRSSSVNVEMKALQLRTNWLVHAPNDSGTLSTQKMKHIIISLGSPDACNKCFNCLFVYPCVPSQPWLLLLHLAHSQTGAFFHQPPTLCCRCL